MQSTKKKSRLSILKPAKPKGTPNAEEADVQSANDTVLNRTKRVSFQRKSLVKTFRLAEDNKNTVWDNTYEEEVNHMDSSSSQNEDGYCASENIFNTTAFMGLDLEGREVFPDLNSDQLNLIDKENINPANLFTYHQDIVSFQEVVNIQSAVNVNPDIAETQNKSLACYEEELSQNDDMEFTCITPSSNIITNNHIIERDQNYEVDDHQIEMHQQLPVILGETDPNDSDMEFTCKVPSLEISKKNIIIQRDHVSKTDNRIQNPVPPSVNLNGSEMEFTCQVPVSILENLNDNDIIGNTKCNSITKQNPEPISLITIAKNIKIIEKEANKNKIIIKEQKSLLEYRSVQTKGALESTGIPINDSEMEFTCQVVPPLKIPNSNKNFQEGEISKVDDRPVPSVNDSEMEFTCQVPPLEISKKNKMFKTDHVSDIVDVDQPVPTNDSAMEFTCQVPPLKISKINKIFQEDSKVVDQPILKNDSAMEFTCQVPPLEISKKNKISCKDDISKVVDQPVPINDSEMEFTCQVPPLEISKMNKICCKDDISKVVDQPVPTNDSEMEFTCQVPPLEISKKNKIFQKDDVNKVVDQPVPTLTVNDSEMDFTCQVPTLKNLNDINTTCTTSTKTKRNPGLISSLTPAKNNKIIDKKANKIIKKQKSAVIANNDNDSEMDFSCEIPPLTISCKNNQNKEITKIQSENNEQIKIKNANIIAKNTTKKNTNLEISEMEFTCQVHNIKLYENREQQNTELCKTPVSIATDIDTSHVSVFGSLNNQENSPSEDIPEPSLAIQRKADDNTTTVNLKEIDNSNIIRLAREHDLFESSLIHKSSYKLEEYLGNGSIHIKANHLPESLSKNKGGFSSLLTFSELYDSNKDSLATSNDIFGNHSDADVIKLEDESLKLDASAIMLDDSNTSSGIRNSQEFQLYNSGEEASKRNTEEFLSLLNNFNCKPLTPRPSPFRHMDYASINSLLEENEKLMGVMKTLRLKPINFPHLSKKTEESNSSDTSGACDLEQTKAVNAAKNDFEELKKLPTPKTLLEQILDVSERCKSYCDFLKHEGETYWFKTLHGALILVADLSSEGVVVDLKIEQKPSKRCTTLEHYVIKMFVESLETTNLESALGFRFNIFSLMDYTHMTMIKMLELDDFLEKMQWNHGLQIDANYRFVFKILEYREIRQIWVISIDLSDSRKKPTPDCVDVEVVTFGLSDEIKKRYAADLKELVEGCPKGHSFLKEYFEKIQGYVGTLKRRNQLKLAHKRNK